MTSRARSISLTDHMDVSEGAHILYFYSSDEGYMDNALAFVRSGLEQNQQILLFDSQQNYEQICRVLAGDGLEQAISEVHFIDHGWFYGADSLEEGFYKDELGKLAQAMKSGGTSVRSWGHVCWREESEAFFPVLQEYERYCDELFGGTGLFGVCVYDARKVPAAVQNELLKSHEYFMTDTSLMPSMLYEKKDRSVLFPSLAVQAQMQSEVNLYKQKLDFVHVVSHEVRNPLTVIKAYARMLMEQEKDGASRHKLQSITDYADVIDNEMAHIINTEQMLSTESLWEKTWIKVLPVLEEVNAIMETKARTQAIGFDSCLQLMGEQIYGNVIGLKLIVSNLLSNAIKYSHEGGRIRIEAFAEDGELVVAIRDEGIGMSDEQIRKLFRKYEKMNVERSGQGIGLFMVKKLVDHFGGRIEVNSRLHTGTLMKVSLPLSGRALT
ncbi:MEDS domain-containing protein [Paenibacillus tarimensis]|uniref:MEDS domain-containing protein n=1 Tax=Paenibacillus tarimensis TaxID=416012 RepID=UPI001F257DCA|nr:MEDS domain-containing protein [Paenibacillus tarimensis]MCF2945104.1 MEDS domain-containing protein [Paenibacillus tarimensis]